MMIVLVILIKNMKIHLLHSVTNRCWYSRASSPYSTNWYVSMFVLKVCLAGSVLVLVAHSNSLNTFIIL